MAYATVTELRAYLPQAATGAATDATLQAVLDRVSAYIDGRIGHGWGTAAIGTRTVYGTGIPYLTPPVHVAGSVTAVTAPAGYTVPAYIQDDGSLVTLYADGTRSHTVQTGLTAWSASAPVWVRGIPYVVSATYGYGAVPADLVEATLELAVRVWRGRDSGFSNVVGVEGGGAVGYNGAEPPLVTKILDRYATVPRGAGVR